MGEAELLLGWRTALLGAAILQLLALAIVLAVGEGVRAANRLLSALLIVIAGMLVPYTIGFAGFYDAWRGLTFLPVSISLAFFFLKLPASGIVVDLPLIAGFPAVAQPDEGIHPDLSVSTTAEDVRLGRDPQMAAATRQILSA